MSKVVTRNLFRIVLLICLLSASQNSIAAQLTFQEGPVTYVVTFEDAIFTTDSNGYLILPLRWNYELNSISGHDPSKAYKVLLGQYQGNHCYWGNLEAWEQSWYFYNVPNTEGMILAFIKADNAARFNISDLSDLGIQPDGGPAQIDAGGYTRISSDANIDFTGLLDVTVVRAPWSQVFFVPGRTITHSIVNMTVSANSCLPSWTATFNLLTAVDNDSGQTTYIFLKDQPAYPVSVTVPGGWCGSPFTHPLLTVNLFDKVTANSLDWGIYATRDGSFPGEQGGAVVASNHGCFVRIGWANSGNSGWPYGGWYGGYCSWNLPPNPSGTYNLQFDFNGQLSGPVHNLAVESTSNGVAWADPASGYEGGMATLMAVPDPDSRFVSWSIDDAGGGSISSVSANPAIFTIENSDATITANFVKLDSSPTMISGVLSIPNSGKNLQLVEGMVEDPIDTGTGSHVIRRSLLNVRGAQELEFNIDYDSINRFDGILGVGWSHNFETWLQPTTNDSVRLNWNAKKSNVFVPQPSDTNLFRCSDYPVIHHVLSRNTNGTYTLTDPTRRRHEFDIFGRLTAVINPQGQAIELIYQSTNLQPAQIREAISGKSIFLTYGTNGFLIQISDDLTRTVDFSFDSSNRLTNIVKSHAGISQTNTFAYDPADRITSAYTPEGLQLFRNTYDAYGRVATQDDGVSSNALSYFYYDESQTNRLITTVVDRTGVTNFYVHDQNYLLLSVTDALGNTISYGYDDRGNRIAITNALGNVRRFAYDSLGNLISETDEARQTTFYGYDNRNNLIALTNAAGYVASFAYDENNNLTNSVDFMGYEISRAYDTNSLLIETISPRGGRTTFVYSNGLPVRITDPATNAIRMLYDPVGRLIAITNADGFSRTNAYDLNDSLIATADGLRHVWRYTYDSAGRKLTETPPIGLGSQFTYDGNGNLSTFSNGRWTRYFYDGQDRLTAVTDANGHIKRMLYDAAGRLIATVNALNQTNFFQYDAIGNLVAAVDALGVTNQINSYDERNLLVSSRDALGNEKRFSYDALRQLTLTVDALNRTNRFTYNPLGKLVGSTDPLLLATYQQFDADGNRTAIINPKLAETGGDHDLANRLTNMVSATGKKTRYSFNKRNLTTKITEPSGTQTTLNYDGANRLISSLVPGSTITYAYDNKDRPGATTEAGKFVRPLFNSLDQVINYRDAETNTITYAYDPVGNLTNLTYPDGKKVAYTYNAADRLETVTDWDGRVTTYFYDANGRVTAIAHPNGTVTTKRYDLAGRVIEQQDLTSLSNIIYQVTYSYDAVGQITNETSIPAPVPFRPTPVAMTFDEDNALTSYAGQPVTNDANGNMTFGPLPNGGFSSYTYDARNRLRSAGGISYGYDPAGHRVAITNGAEVTTFVVNPNAALSQTLIRAKNSVTNYYVYGLSLLYEVTSEPGFTNVLTYHFDYRGSTVALTDDGQNVTDRVSYAPYGGITSRLGTNDTPFLFNGSYGVMTEANGLFYMRARYYNSTTCRFLNADPIGFAGGMNFHTYAEGNPINLIDPFGLCAEKEAEESNFDLISERLLKVRAQNDAFIQSYTLYLVEQGFGEIVSRIQNADALLGVARLNPSFDEVLNDFKAGRALKTVSRGLEVLNYGQLSVNAMQSFGTGKIMLGVSYSTELTVTVVAEAYKAGPIVTAGLGWMIEAAEREARRPFEAAIEQPLINAMKQRERINMMIQDLQTRMSKK